VKTSPLSLLWLLPLVCSSLAAQTPAAPKPPLESHVYEWNELEVVPIPNGERRPVFDGPTATVDQLHCHITSLAVGQVSGEPRLHHQEEIIIIKEGEVEVTCNGRTRKAGAGSVIFFASQSVTRLRNIGTVPATYYVMYYYTPKTPRE